MPVIGAVFWMIGAPDLIWRDSIPSEVRVTETERAARWPEAGFFFVPYRIEYDTRVAT
jgi:hypothetical protein